MPAAAAGAGTGARFPLATVARAVPSAESAAAAAARAGIDASFALPVARDDDGGRRPGALQTLLFPLQLERMLSKLYADATSAQRELGFNTLFVAIGFLEWYDAESSDRMLQSPLLLLPVRLERTVEAGRYAYALAGNGDEPEANIALAKRLADDFGIVLPPLDPERPVSAYLDAVRAAIRLEERWTIAAYATLGNFNFSRLALYKDLEPGSGESTGAVEGHPIVATLLAGSERADASAGHPFESTEREARELSLSPTLITDADSSQYAAVIDAAKGRDMVIEGPPGTGKSQTITNIIAAALGAGKTVLFVAEKAAALDVVKSRLGRARLGEFCLELHSTSRSKASVFEALKRRRALEHAAGADPRRPLDLARREAAIVDAYDADLHRVRGGSGLSTFDRVWQQNRLRLELGDAGAALLDLAHVAGAESLTEPDLADLADLVSGWADRRAAVLRGLPSLGAHPLARVRDDAALAGEPRAALLRAIGAATAALEAAGGAAFEIARALPASPAASLAGLARDLAFLRAVRDAEPPSTRALTLAASAADPAAESARIGALRALRERAAALGVGLVVAVDASLARCRAFLDAATAAELPDAATAALLDDAIAASEARERELAGLEALAARLAALVETTQPDEAFFSAARTLLEILATLSRDELYARHAPAWEPENLRALRDGVARVDDLDRRTRAVAERFALAALPPPAAVRADARALESAGPLRGLNKPYQDARTRVRAYKRTRDEWDAAAAARHLDEAAAVLDGWAALTADPDAVRVLGPVLRGRETDPAAARRLLEVGTRLDVELGATGAHGRAFARFARRASVDQLDDVRSLAASAAYRELESACTRREGDLGAARAAATAVTAARRAAKRLWPEDAAIARATVGGVRGGVDLALLAAELVPSTADSALRPLIAIDSTEALLRADAEPLDDAARALWYVAVLREHYAGAALELAAGADPAAVVDVARVAAPVAEAALANASSALGDLASLGSLDVGDAGDRPICDVAAELAATRDALRGADEWLAFKRQDARLRARGLEPFAETAIAADPPLDMREALAYVLVRSSIESARTDSPALAEATGVALESARARFAEHDRRLLADQRSQLRAALLERTMPAGNGDGPRGTWTEDRLVELECGKAKRHPALRDFFTRAGRASQALWPCMMMSPLAVAQHVPAGAMTFDVVVIDEASQMRPEDALGAIARGRQLIVVGDPKQLPPTDFFRAADGTADDEESDADSIDAESILDFASQQFGRPRRLLWHYRSRHPALIAFSNAEFYDGELLLFPSPIANRSDVVSSVYVGGAYRASVNPAEADAVVAAAREHMLERPDLSLAIVTMNKPQQELVDAELQQLEKTDPRVGAYFERWGGTGQDFIIKNLETVQGDERDVVMISTVYGPDEASGRVMQRFGPLAKSTGWRRLNVLFTRAKHRIRLFTSLTPADIVVDPGRTSRGVLALRDYLEYAAGDARPKGAITGREPESDFEVSVATALRAAGFDVVPQVGAAGFFIDLAVRDPANPARYVAGIECDGRAFHSSKSARDRDRIREDVLAGMGWTILRVWSTDWFANPRHETARLVEGIRVRVAEGGAA